MTLNLKSQALNPLAVFAFPAVCQICNEQRAEPADGFVCAYCLRNVFRTQRPWCEQCGLPFDGEFTETTACLNCLDLEWDFDGARSLFASKGLVREVIHRFKYNGAEFFQPLMNRWIRVFSSDFKESPDWIVPIPLHPLKERERGFNQADRLAEAVAEVLGVPMVRDAVQRVKNTETQTHLSRSKRLANMNGAFTLRRNRSLMGTVMLVDDVMTTGATASACACVLKNSGTSKVNVFTMARGLPI